MSRKLAFGFQPCILFPPSPHIPLLGPALFCFLIPDLKQNPVILYLLRILCSIGPANCISILSLLSSSPVEWKMFFLFRVIRQGKYDVFSHSLMVSSPLESEWGKRSSNKTRELAFIKHQRFAKCFTYIISSILKTTLVGKKCKTCEETAVLREEPCCPQRTRGSLSYSRLLLIERVHLGCWELGPRGQDTGGQRWDKAQRITTLDNMGEELRGKGYSDVRESDPALIFLTPVSVCPIYKYCMCLYVCTCNKDNWKTHVICIDTDYNYWRISIKSKTGSFFLDCLCTKKYKWQYFQELLTPIAPVFCG